MNTFTISNGTRSRLICLDEENMEGACPSCGGSVYSDLSCKCDDMKSFQITFVKRISLLNCNHRETLKFTLHENDSETFDRVDDLLKLFGWEPFRISNDAELQPNKNTHNQFHGDRITVPRDAFIEAFKYIVNGAEVTITCVEEIDPV